MNDIQKEIFETVNILVQRALEKTDYARIIQGTVVGCLDASAGKYLIEKDNSTFIAYTEGTKTVSIGDVVSIATHNNDSTQHRIILSGGTDTGPGLYWGEF